MGVIYKITSPSSKIYVGKTYDLRKRINSHKCSAKQGKNILLHNSIRKYGWDAHVLEVIEEVDDLLMDEREMFWITELKTYCYDNKMGLNMTKGGEGQRSTWMHKTELRKYYSNKFSGEGNPFYGKKHTPEVKKIMSEKASIRNKISGRKVPKWGAEKARQVVMKPVICYDSNGEYIKEYISVTEAANKLGVEPSCVSANCRGEQTNANWFVFRYKTENYPLKIDVDIKPKTVKRPVLTLNEDYEVICEHESAKEASDFWGVPKTTINRAAMYNWLVPIRSGHIFIYKDLYAEILALTA